MVGVSGIRVRVGASSSRRGSPNGPEDGDEVMHVDFEDTVVRGLRRYVRSVGTAVGLDGECSYIHTEEPTTAYIPMEGRLREFPERDVALLWDERHG
jgi:hypothetical protein